MVLPLRVAVALGLGLLWGALTSAAETKSTSRALLIGIQTYAQFGDGWWDLDGPANDIALVRGILVDRLGFAPANITVLQDRAATRAAIKQAFADLARKSRPGDRVYIHYSGHGSSVDDRNGDEGTRRKDSTLIPVDAWGKGPPQILDDEIAVWLDRLLEKTPDVVFVVDACHSGTITRGLESLKVRGVSIPDSRDYAWSDSLREAVANSRQRDLGRTRFVRASACRDDEEAHEYLGPDGKAYGLFTWAWCEALARAGNDASVADLFRVVEARIFREKGTHQEPQLEGASDQFLVARGVTRSGVTGPRLAVLRAESGKIVFRGGLLSGVTVGSVYSRVGSGASRAEIVSVTADEAVAKMVAGDAAREGDLFAEVFHKNAFPPFRVVIQAEPGAEAQAKALGELLQANTRVQVVKKKADLVVALQQKGTSTSCAFLDGSEAPWGGGRIDPKLLVMPVSDENSLRLVERNLNRLFDNETLLRIADAYQDSLSRVDVRLVQLVPRKGNEVRRALTCVNPEPSAEPCEHCYARVALATGTSKNEKLRLGNGAMVSFWVRNRSLKPVYAYVVNVLPSGQVISLPASGGEPAFIVPPLDSLALETASRLLEDPGLIDTYLCFVTDEPVPLWNLNLGPLVADASGAVLRGSSDALGELLALTDSQTRGGSGGALLAARRFSVLVGL